MKLTPEQQKQLRELEQKREIEYDKLVQACQSGAYKAWKGRRKKVNKLNEQISQLSKLSGEAWKYQERHG